MRKGEPAGNPGETGPRPSRARPVNTPRPRCRRRPRERRRRCGCGSSPRPGTARSDAPFRCAARRFGWRPSCVDRPVVSASMENVVIARVASAIGDPLAANRARPRRAAAAWDEPRDRWDSGNSRAAAPGAASPTGFDCQNRDTGTDVAARRITVMDPMKPITMGANHGSWSSRSDPCRGSPIGFQEMHDSDRRTHRCDLRAWRLPAHPLDRRSSPARR